ncbi:ferredoxin reductase [Pseudomonas sp. CGJS7]|uniref:ferredoxin reductase n=1 Tax=Pseudomonas sp. CGJS7 TaxID=3109348 RepID=UPI00300BA9F6
MNAALRPSVRRPQSRLRRLIAPLVAPQVFDFWASKLHPTLTWERPLARIVERSPASADAVTLLLAPNRHWAGARAGQHLMIGARIDGVLVSRSYSLSDAPRGDGRIAITVKAIEGGKLSRHLHDHAQVGDVLEIGEAFGEMVLPERNDGAWLFLAAGSGITPLMAMTRELAAQGMPAPLTLLYWARRREELCFVDELRALAAQHPNFQVRFLLTRQAPEHAHEHAGRIDAELLSQHVEDLSARRVYACGPGGFVAQAREVGAAHARAFDAEAFTPPPRVVAEEGLVEVVLARSGRTLALPRGQSLLTALEAHGLNLPSGCRMGLCNTCSCGKSSGSTRHLHTGAEQAEPVSSLRLCVNSATSHLVLDL